MPRFNNHRLRFISKTNVNISVARTETSQNNSFYRKRNTFIIDISMTIKTQTARTFIQLTINYLHNSYSIENAYQLILTLTRISRVKVVFEAAKSAYFTICCE